MEAREQLEESLADLPASDLWGRVVRDARGRSVGTIDSIVRSSNGPVRAMVRTGEPRRVILIDLMTAMLDGDAVVIPWFVESGESTVRENEPAPARHRLLSLVRRS